MNQKCPLPPSGTIRVLFVPFSEQVLTFALSGAMMSVDETLMCSFQILKPADKKKFPYGGLNSGRPVTKMNKK